MACKDQPVTCRARIAERYQLAPNKRRQWQYEGKCPNCHHGGFSITAPDQGPNAPRHIWWCNCHRCRCPPEVVRAAMLRDGISADCLGSYRRNTPATVPADPAAVLRAAMMEVLADPKIRALADLKIKMLEVIAGQPAPADWPGFVAFAARAGVQRSRRYDAAARWGRSATAVGTGTAPPMSSKPRSDGVSAVPNRDSSKPRLSRFGKADSPVSGQQTQKTNRTG